MCEWGGGGGDSEKCRGREEDGMERETEREAG